MYKILCQDIDSEYALQFIILVSNELEGLIAIK